MIADELLALLLEVQANAKFGSNAKVVAGSRQRQSTRSLTIEELTISITYELSSQSSGLGRCIRTSAHFTFHVRDKGELIGPIPVCTDVAVWRGDLEPEVSTFIAGHGEQERLQKAFGDDRLRELLQALALQKREY